MQAREDYMHRQLAIVIKSLLNYAVYIIDRENILSDQWKYMNFIEIRRKAYTDLQKTHYRNGRLRQEK